MLKFVKWFAVLGFLALAACKEIPPGEYDVSEVGKLKKVAAGTIISKRAVTFHNKSASNSPAAPGTEFIEGGQGYVYVIKLKTGEIVSVAQAEDLKLKVNQRVLVIYGKHTRILPDDGSSS